MASLTLKRKKSRKPLAAPASSLFAIEDEEEGNSTELSLVEAEKRAVTERFDKQGRKAQAKAQLEFQKVLSEDPTVFQFDEVYDDIQKRRDIAKGEVSHAKEQKSKYINQLLANTRQREFEFERANEKLYQKEQKQEEEQFGKAREVFVTGAYKRRLEERRQWELEEARKAEVEAKNDVTKRGNLSGFYTGMLKTLTKADDTNAKTMTASLSSSDSLDVKQREGLNSSAANVKVYENRGSTDGAEQKTPAFANFEQYKPGDMKRKRQVEEQERTAPVSKVPKSAIEEARRRALERRQKKISKG